MTVGEWLKATFTLNLVELITLITLIWALGQMAFSRPSAVVRRQRRRVLKPLGVNREAIRDRADRIVGGFRPTAADELSWLADQLGVPDGRSLAFHPPTQKLLTSIAEAYASYAARIERGVLFGQNSAPLTGHESALCRDVASMAAARAGVVALAKEAVRWPRAGDPHQSLVLFGCRTSTQDGTPVLLVEFRPVDLLVSYRRDRLVTTASGAEDPAGTLREVPLPNVSEAEREAVARMLQAGTSFDGVLPRLVDWRIEHDPASGRNALHLSLAECTYSTVVVDHYPLKLRPANAFAPRPVSGDRVRLLTLTMVLRTRCGHLAFVKRSALVDSHASRYAAAVNGNLEFRQRRGLVPDLDPQGMPDPRIALAREAKEELGLELDPRRIAVTGLSQFTVPEETHTFNLLCAASVDQTLQELADGLRHADPIEGLPEVGSALLGLRIPGDDKNLQRCVDWLLGTDELTPHASLAGLGALGALLPTRQITRFVFRSKGTKRVVPRPTDLLLEIPLGPRL